MNTDEEFLRRADADLTHVTDLYEGVQTRPLCDDEPEGFNNTLAEISLPTVAGIVILSKTNSEQWIVAVLLRDEIDGETRSAFEAELSVSDALEFSRQIRSAAIRASLLNEYEAAK